MNTNIRINLDNYQLSSKHQIIDTFERVFFRHTSAIFRHVARLYSSKLASSDKKIPCSKSVDYSMLTTYKSDLEKILGVFQVIMDYYKATLN